MMTTARLAAALATVLAVGVMPSAGASSRPPAVTLGGSVTLSGSGSYVREVVLPRPVTFQEQTWHETWRITAPRGRFAGYALRPKASEVEGVAFALTRGYCLTRACARPPWVSSYGNGCLCNLAGPTPGVVTLPAGRYRLYLIADGAPVTVTLKFPGLTGKVSIRTGAPHRPVIDTPKPAVLDPPIAPPAGMGGNRYSAGATHAARDDGLEFGAMYFLVSWKIFGVSPPKSVNQSGGCMFDGPAVPGPLGLYQYPCDVGTLVDVRPGGQVQTGSKTGPGGALDQYATFTEMFGLIHDGPVSLGAYINSHSPASEAHTQIFWLDFLP